MIGWGRKHLTHISPTSHPSVKCLIMRRVIDRVGQKTSHLHLTPSVKCLIMRRVIDRVGQKAFHPYLTLKDHKAPHTVETVHRIVRRLRCRALCRPRSKRGAVSGPTHQRAPWCAGLNTLMIFVGPFLVDAPRHVHTFYLYIPKLSNRAQTVETHRGASTSRCPSSRYPIFTHANRRVRHVYVRWVFSACLPSPHCIWQSKMIFVYNSLFYIKSV